MIKIDFFMKRYDGVDLYRTYSDMGVKIQQDETSVLYDEAIDVEDSGFTYSETDIPIEE